MVNWPLTSLGHVLTVSTTTAEVLDHQNYQQIALRPYPNGVVLKAAKRGLDFKYRQLKQVRAGQFVISPSGAYKRLWGIVPEAFDGAVIATRYLVFDLHPNLNAEYFHAYLATPAFKQAVFLLARKTGRLHLRGFKNIIIPFPEQEAQRSIAEVWQFGREAIEHTEAMFTAFESHKAEVRDQLFRDANPSWERKTVGQSVRFGSKPSVQYPLVVSADTCLWDSRISQQGEVGLIPPPEMDGRFLGYYLQSQQQAIQTALKNVRESTFEAVLQHLPIVLPTLYEQRRIATALEQFDEALLRMRAERLALRRLVIGLMHLIFTGATNWQEVMQALHDIR